MKNTREITITLKYRYKYEDIANKDDMFSDLHLIEKLDKGTKKINTSLRNYTRYSMTIIKWPALDEMEKNVTSK